MKRQNCIESNYRKNNTSSGRITIYMHRQYQRGICTSRGPCYPVCCLLRTFCPPRWPSYSSCCPPPMSAFSWLDFLPLVFSTFPPHYSLGCNPRPMRDAVYSPAAAVSGRQVSTTYIYILRLVVSRFERSLPFVFLFLFARDSAWFSPCLNFCPSLIMKKLVWRRRVTSLLSLLVLVIVDGRSTDTPGRYQSD